METSPLAASPSPLAHGLLRASCYRARASRGTGPGCPLAGELRAGGGSRVPEPCRRSRALPNPPHGYPGHGPARGSGVSAPPRVCNGVGAAWEGLRHAARQGCLLLLLLLRPRHLSASWSRSWESCSLITGPGGGAANAGSLRAAARWLRGWLGRAPGTLPCAQGDARRGRSAHARPRGCQRE